MIIKPFAAIRPRDDLAPLASSLPSGSQERRAMSKSLSSLHIDAAEIPAATEPEELYSFGRQMLDERCADGTFITEDAPCFYLYKLVREGHSQIGVAACCSIDDYASGVIKKHENTIEAKERNCVRRQDTLNAQTGPIYLAYRDNEKVDALVEEARKAEPLYSFVSEEGVRNTVWRISDSATIDALVEAFAEVPTAYIADGHHRTAAAVSVGFTRREKRGTFVGAAESDYFMSVLFPANQLSILSFNRLVRDLNLLSGDAFLDRLVGEQGAYEMLCEQEEPFVPTKKGEMGVYLGGRWYGVVVRESVVTDDPVFSLDVSLLQTHVLGPILGIEDPRVDERISFISGIQGVGELSSRVDAIDAEGGSAVAFSMYPTAIEELLRVADAGRLMPPKSTWFEPKLRSGLFIHDLL